MLPMYGLHRNREAMSVTLTITTFSLPHELWRHVVLYLPFDMMIVVRSVSHDLRNISNAILDTEYNNLLNHAHLDAAPFRALMSDTHAIILGQIPLAHLFREHPSTVTQVDVACPLHTFPILLDRIKSEFHCTFSPFHKPSDPVILGKTSSDTAICLSHTPLDTPLALVPSDMVTIDSNALTHCSLISLYPSLTLNRRGLYGPHCDSPGTEVPWYESHGWLIHTSDGKWNEQPADTCYTPWCARGTRTVGDSHCLQLLFNYDDLTITHAYNTGTKFLPYDTSVQYQRGGRCNHDWSWRSWFGVNVVGIKPDGTFEEFPEDEQLLHIAHPV
ncbi:hypothetical protein EIP91_001805 [Steccherinum ochraceum]|uniref:F-box domain-containing protein n=1 Tax=Steccherinum ochraceum TaxID=92696 RepID=A0A4R0S2S3_9APHY|nr:hypothetical protein EIP91_001805 [Steccherinum ochraceum]